MLGRQGRGDGAPGGDSDVTDGGRRGEADCGGAGDDEMVGATGGARERSTYPCSQARDWLRYGRGRSGERHHLLNNDYSDVPWLWKV